MYIEINDKSTQSKSIGTVRDRAILKPPPGEFRCRVHGLVHGLALEFGDGMSDNISHQQDGIVHASASHPPF
jgi:hypothetical protein